MSKNHTILDAADIDRKLTRITHEILEVHKGVSNLTLIDIQTRGVFLAKRIQSRINDIEGIEMPTGEMDITLYRDDLDLDQPQSCCEDNGYFLFGR